MNHNTTSTDNNTPLSTPVTPQDIELTETNLNDDANDTISVSPNTTASSNVMQTKHPINLDNTQQRSSSNNSNNTTSNNPFSVTNTPDNNAKTTQSSPSTNSQPNISAQTTATDATNPFAETAIPKNTSEEVEVTIPDDAQDNDKVSDQTSEDNTSKFDHVPLLKSTLQNLEKNKQSAKNDQLVGDGISALSLAGTGGSIGGLGIAGVLILVSIGTLSIPFLAPLLAFILPEILLLAVIIAVIALIGSLFYMVIGQLIKHEAREYEKMQDQDIDAVKEKLQQIGDDSLETTEETTIDDQESEVSQDNNNALTDDSALIDEHDTTEMHNISSSLQEHITHDILPENQQNNTISDSEVLQNAHNTLQEHASANDSKDIKEQQNDTVTTSNIPKVTDNSNQAMIT